MKTHETTQKKDQERKNTIVRKEVERLGGGRTAAKCWLVPGSSDSKNGSHFDLPAKRTQNEEKEIRTNKVVVRKAGGVGGEPVSVATAHQKEDSLCRRGLCVLSKVVQSREHVSNTGQNMVCTQGRVHVKVWIGG